MAFIFLVGFLWRKCNSLSLFKVSFSCVIRNSLRIRGYIQLLINPSMDVGIQNKKIKDLLEIRTWHCLIHFKDLWQEQIIPTA